MITRDDITRLIDQYRSGIEAELNLLRQLSEISTDQKSSTHQGNFSAFAHAADERDRIMRTLVTIEEGLRDVRAELSAHRDIAASVRGFDEVLTLHRDAAALVTAIMAADQASLSALADAELAHRSAVASLERGEATMAAYRRVLAPPIASAALLDRRG